MMPPTASVPAGPLPLPHKIELSEGFARLTHDSPLEIHATDPRIERATLELRSALGKTDTQIGKPAPTRMKILTDKSIPGGPDAYRLTVGRAEIRVIGSSAAGCFYGLQTLRQLSAGSQPCSQAHEGWFALPHRSCSPSRVPCCDIKDRPDFATRGLLHDVTRGKVPTLATLKLLVDRLAGFKANQLQLYIEHAFTFAFDPDICTHEEGLTPEEIREVNRYAHERYVELVPALATLGHMGRILSMPRYRHLAEIDAPNEWAAMTWPQRARGLTLDCTNPESLELVRRMWSDVLDCFPARAVNICGDEPHDLGRGRSRARTKRLDVPAAYVDHLRKTHDICAARGRRTQFWSDVIRTHAHVLDRLPRDSTVLHWGYDDNAAYSETSTFTDGGLTTFVCPGTSGWKRILNAMGLAERNITRFAAEGLSTGATGLLNTDWGDHGHFNPLACSWHAIALGAALAWNANHPTGSPFDESFARTVLNVPDARGIEHLRAASKLAEECETWHLFWKPARGVEMDAALPSADAIEEMRRHASAFLRWSAGINRAGTASAQDLRELRVACTFLELFGDKVTMLHKRFRSETRRALGQSRPVAGPVAARSAHGSDSPPAEQDILSAAAAPGTRHGNDKSRSAAEWKERLAEASASYADCWNARNKPAGLNDVLRAFSGAAEDFETGPP